MAYISNQWLKGGREWVPVITKLELNNTDWSKQSFEFTLKKEIGIFKCQNKDCLNEDETEFQITAEDSELNYPSRGFCHYCFGELDFVKRAYHEHQTLIFSSDEGEMITDFLTSSFDNNKVSILLSNLVDKLSDSSKLKILKKILDNC